jgi:hypothetical protein
MTWAVSASFHIFFIIVYERGLDLYRLQTHSEVFFLLWGGGGVVVCFEYEAELFGWENEQEIRGQTTVYVQNWVRQRQRVRNQIITFDH